jgi:hypothetical protein
VWDGVLEGVLVEDPKKIVGDNTSDTASTRLGHSNFETSRVVHEQGRVEERHSALVKPFKSSRIATAWDERLEGLHKRRSKCGRDLPHPLLKEFDVQVVLNASVGL